MEQDDFYSDLAPKISSKTDFQLHHGDCIAGMKLLPEDSVDLVVTSPPYNLGINYGKYKDKLDEDHYLNWSADWVAEIKRILKPKGSFFLNVAGSSKDPLMPHRLILKLSEQLVLQNTIHWVKSITVKPRDQEEMSVGHFKPINSKRYLNDCHEFLFHLTQDGNVPLDRTAVGVEYADKSNIKRWKHTSGKDKRCRGNNWFIPYETILSRSKERPHPATFPILLAERCIDLHGREEVKCMVEPFLGIGHAATAAAQCEVPRFIGYEIDGDYLNVACARLQVQPAGKHEGAQ